MVRTTLRSIVADLNAHPDEHMICARKPWSGLSDAVVTEPTEELGVPAKVREDGYEYFLEVFIAHEVLGVFSEPRGLDDQVRLLIHYAEHDAYPEWAFAPN